MALTVTYVGSEGTSCRPIAATARGYWSDALDPKYLSLGHTHWPIRTKAPTITADCATYNLTCPASNYCNTPAAEHAS